MLILENAIREKNSKESYQSPRNIWSALNIIEVDKIWTKLGTEMNIPPSDIKNELNLIIERRNKIADEADFNPTTGNKFIINKQITKNVVDFIELLCESMF